MGLTRLDETLWLTGFFGHLLLLGILVGRRRSAAFPFFTAYIAFAILKFIVDFSVLHKGSSSAYFWTYWSLVSLDALLQLGVIYEMAHEVLRPAGQWVQSTRATFLAISSGGAILAAALSYLVDPMAASTVIAWSIRFNLFTSLLIAELVIAMFLAASRVGLQWRNYVMAVAEGMGAWVCISIAIGGGPGNICFSSILECAPILPLWHTGAYLFGEQNHRVKVFLPICKNIFMRSVTVWSTICGKLKKQERSHDCFICPNTAGGNLFFGPGLCLLLAVESRQTFS